MRVAHCGVGDQELFLLQHPIGDGFGALFVEEVLCAFWRSLVQWQWGPSCSDIR